MGRRRKRYGCSYCSFQASTLHRHTNSRSANSLDHAYCPTATTPPVKHYPYIGVGIPEGDSRDPVEVTHAMYDDGEQKKH